MYCEGCGKEVSDTAKFCKYCGARVWIEEAKSEEAQSQQSEWTVLEYEPPARLIPQSMLKEGEKIVFEAHPHKVYTLLGSWILGTLLAILGGLLFILSIPMGMLFEILAFLSFFIPYLMWKHTIYALTTVWLPQLDEFRNFLMSEEAVVFLAQAEELALTP